MRVRIKDELKISLQQNCHLRVRYRVRDFHLPRTELENYTRGEASNFAFTEQHCALNEKVFRKRAKSNFYATFNLAPIC